MRRALVEASCCLRQLYSCGSRCCRSLAFSRGIPSFLFVWYAFISDIPSSMLYSSSIHVHLHLDACIPLFCIYTVLPVAGYSVAINGGGWVDGPQSVTSMDHADGRVKPATLLLWLFLSLAKGERNWVDERGDHHPIIIVKVIIFMYAAFSFFPRRQSSYLRFFLSVVGFGVGFSPPCIFVCFNRYN